MTTANARVDPKPRERSNVQPMAAAAGGPDHLDVDS
jgi:hypothetical protein